MDEAASLTGQRSLADRAREWFAVLATLALSTFAAALVLILWRGPWSAGSEAQRLGFIGAALIMVIGLIGLGASWLWRLQFKSFEVRAGLVQVSAQAAPAPHEG